MAQKVSDLQAIIIGNDVDDGRGDYLRKGGEKINTNFDSLFYALGDGKVPHAAGAWKTWTHANGAVLKPQFGESWTIDTSGGKVTVQLPTGGINQYNSVIRLRDIWNIWGTNNIILQHDPKDTIKGKKGTVTIYRNGADLELVYCANGRWDYVDNKTVGKITTSDNATVARKGILITPEMGNTTDFKDIFSAPYNTANLEIYHRGNLLYYGDKFGENSDYGSQGATASEMVDLDGTTIRLRSAAKPGDTVIFVTYMDGIASYRSSYSRFSIQVLDSSKTGKVTEPGRQVVADLKTKFSFDRDELGLGPQDFMNPNTVEVTLNGHSLMKAGEASYPVYRCVGADGDTMEQCTSNGGEWTLGGQDFSLTYDDFDRVDGILIGTELEHEDVLSVRWFNNDIGSTLDWDGENGIRELADEVYLNSEGTFDLKNQIEYSNYDEPSHKTKQDLPAAPNTRIADIRSFLDLIFPIGSIYSNAHNPAPPSDYMGFGIWRRWSEGLASVGWSSDTNNVFNVNPQTNVQESAGIFGSMGTVIKPLNIPEMKTAEDVLVRDDNGPIIIGSCMADPETEGPAETKYRVDKATIAQSNTTPSAIDVIQPSVTEYKWIRVA